jgi:organic radical activating enzyme
MTTRFPTISFCPTCYAEVSASVTVGREAVTMNKSCPHHGQFTSMVERDPLFYQAIRGLRAPSIYDGYFVDVTRRCNLRCEHCYYKLETTDPEGEYSIPAILNECAVSRHRAPFIITGGEPTTREDIGEVIRNVRQIGPVELLTNGTGLTKPELWTELVPLLTNEGTDTINVNLSLHVKETDAWREVVNRCRAEGVKLESALIVINSKDEFWEAMTLCKEISDVVECYRIKAASRIWNEQKPEGKIFVSDMYRWLEESGKPVVLVPQRHNKVSIVNVAYDRMHLMLVSWYDVSNIDLVDVDCAPYYRARNGEVQNFVTAMMINEGLSKGWLKGRPVTAITEERSKTK